jgi:hypothetical protein
MIKFFAIVMNGWGTARACAPGGGAAREREGKSLRSQSCRHCLLTMYVHKIAGTINHLMA